MPVFLPPRCEDCGAKPGDPHLSWCPDGPGAHLPRRIQLSRAKGWRKPPEVRVVTRGTIFGNPWAVDTAAAFHWPHPDRCGWQGSYRVPAGELTPTQAVSTFTRWLADGYVPLEMWPVSLTPIGEDELGRHLAARRTALLERLEELRTRPLACFCDLGTPCHADVLIGMANANLNGASE
ncbi:DUF4326 domain-containing protein [Vannielia litorea]|uniref:DUF4326 domain-containing protein n=1 Tax=Vannielia litorea TaxID=1217970 RepID=UPI001BCD2ED8|nr:DUF4326 domain-containing protein [Vannielia litorea]